MWGGVVGLIVITCPWRAGMRAIEREGGGRGEGGRAKGERVRERERGGERETERERGSCGQARMVSEELVRVAILWHEMWHEALEEASRLYFAEHDVEGMLEVPER